jgi:hypothetical protein
MRKTVKIIILVLGLIHLSQAAHAGDLTKLKEFIDSHDAIKPLNVSPFKWKVEVFEGVEDFGQFSTSLVDKFLNESMWTPREDGRGHSIGDLISAEWRVNVNAGYNNGVAERKFQDFIKRKYRYQTRWLLKLGRNSGNTWYHVNLYNNAAEPVGQDLFIIRDTDVDGAILVLHIKWADG